LLRWEQLSDGIEIHYQRFSSYQIDW